jgi:two-component system cell cycle sensor histidine kinase/response regulator CckA
MAVRAALRIALVYLVLATVWILASDTLMAWLIPDDAQRLQMSMAKGLFYVVVTAAVLFVMVRAQMHNLDGERARVQSAHDSIVAQDLELRAALSEKQRLYTELEAKSARSQSLEAQLRQSQKMEGIGRLAGGVAHDFNNMLTVILGATELLPDELPPQSPGRSLVEEIQKAAERCAGLTRQLLIFSRKQVARVELLELQPQVVEARRMLERLIGEDIQFSTSLEGPTAHVRLDPIHLQQLIVNLVVNARDAMPHGGSLLVSTEVRAVDAELCAGHAGVVQGPFVVLSVTDTGCGMSPEVIEHAFEPFFTTKPEGKGTGLGLATVWEIVHQASGFVTVESVVDRGTTFRVFLPLADVRTTGSAIGRDAAQARRGTERILLVEDEEGLRTMIHHTLKRRGYTVLEAKNAGEALLLSEQSQERIDLLLADVVMPLLRGSQLAARLKEIQPSLKVVLMTGYVEDLEAELAHSRADDLLLKPFSADVLTERIRNVLDAPPPTPRIAAGAG